MLYKPLQDYCADLFSGLSQQVPSSGGNQCQKLSELHQLKTLYGELVPSSKLDATIVTDWGRCEMEELFNEEFCENSDLNSHLLMTTVSQIHKNNSSS